MGIHSTTLSFELDHYRHPAVMRMGLPFKSSERKIHDISSNPQINNAHSQGSPEKPSALRKQPLYYPVSHEEEEAHLSENSLCSQKTGINYLALDVTSSLSFIHSGSSSLWASCLI